MGAVLVEYEWLGADIQARIKRANGRSIVSGGEQVAAHAKQIVHVQSGDLRRSIHAAKLDSMGEVEATSENVLKDFDAQVEVGSWLAYACVEESGRHHYYIAPAMAIVAPTFIGIIEAAYAAEGLR